MTTTPVKPANPTPRPARPWLVPLLVLAAVVAGVAVAALLTRGDDADNQSTLPQSADISSLPFTMDDGATDTLADFQGQPTVVNFFASWCAPCRAEMPDLETVHQETAGQVSFLGISHDFTEDTWRAFVAESAITYPTGFQPNTEIFTAIGATGMPTTMLLDSSGGVVATHVGLITADDLRGLIADNFGVTATGDG